MYQTRFVKSSQEIHTSATIPLHVVLFALDTTYMPHHNSTFLLLRPRGDCCSFAGSHWGKQHAILAGLDRAAHQSGEFRARTLATRAPFGHKCGIGILSKLRKFFADCAAADWSTPTDDAPRTDCAPAPPKTTIIFC